MNLAELVEHVRQRESWPELLDKDMAGVDIDQIDIYLRSKLDVESEVKFFDTEEIPNELEIVIDGVSYVNLFPMTMLREMINDYLERSGSSLSNMDIARKLISYRIVDA